MFGWFLYVRTALSIGSWIFSENERLALLSVNSSSSVIFAKYSLTSSAIFHHLKQVRSILDDKQVFCRSEDATYCAKVEWELLM